MTMNVEFNNNFLVKAPFELGFYQISLFFEKYRKYDLAPSNGGCIRKLLVVRSYE
jgi:hypothetical protein